MCFSASKWNYVYYARNIISLNHNVVVQSVNVNVSHSKEKTNNVFSWQCKNRPNGFFKKIEWNAEELMEFGMSDWFTIIICLAVVIFVKGTPFQANSGCCNIIQEFHPKLLRMRKLISWIQFLLPPNLPKKPPVHSSSS